MNTRSTILAVLLCAFAAITVAMGQSKPEAQSNLKKSAGGVSVSDDGKWIAYSEVSGKDCQLVVRSTTDGKERRFPQGEVTPYPNFVLAGDVPGPWVRFSLDSASMFTYRASGEGKIAKDVPVTPDQFFTRL